MSRLPAYWRAALVAGFLAMLPIDAIGAGVIGVMAPKSSGQSGKATVKSKAGAKRKAGNRKRHGNVVLATAYLRGLHKKMVARKSLTQRELQALADAGDGLAAFNLAKGIEASAIPGTVDDTVRLYALAVKSGRKMAVRSLIRSVGAPGVAPERLAEAESILLKTAKSGSDLAGEALRRFYTVGQPFGLKQDVALDLMKSQAKKGDTKAAMDIAISLLKTRPLTEDDRQSAITYLAMAANSDEPGQKAMAEALARELNVEAPTEGSAAP